MSFDFAASIALRPRGDTRAGLVAFYGDPTAGSVRTGRGTFEPPASFRAKTVKIPIEDLPGFPPYADPSVKITGVTFHAHVAPVFRATWKELVARRLHTRLRTYDGAVTYRHMLWNYANPVSLHAYAAAVDFDAAWNRYGLPRAQMQIDPEVVQCFCECGWHAGYFWNPTDGMHLQWTDPLPGVPVPEYQDAMARRSVSIVKPEIATPPAATPADIPALPQGTAEFSWRHIRLRDLSGKDVPPPTPEFIYNGTIVRVRGNQVAMERSTP